MNFLLCVQGGNTRVRDATAIHTGVESLAGTHIPKRYHAASPCWRSEPTAGVFPPPQAELQEPARKLQPATQLWTVLCRPAGQPDAHSQIHTRTREPADRARAAHGTARTRTLTATQQTHTCAALPLLSSGSRSNISRTTALTARAWQAAKRATCACWDCF